MHPILTSALAALSIAHVGRSDDPRFAVEADSTLTKSFESTVHLASKSFKISVDGDDELLSGMGDVQFSLDSSERIEVTDEYLSTDEGRPTRLKRTFEKLHGSGSQHAKGPDGEEDDGEAAAEEREEQSELEGHSVLFTWNEDASRFDASFDGEKGKAASDEALLEGLSEDMDFRGMLPHEVVAEGESWDLDAKVFQDVLAPGGDLKLKSAEEEGAGGDIDRKLRENLEGKAHATWKGVREEDGRKIGVIAIVADLTSEGDVAPRGEQTGSTWFKNSLEIEGELLWDLAAGHFRSFEAGGKTEFSLKTTEELSIEDKSVEMVQSIEFEGAVSFKASAR